jgi:hypothetical protein
MSSLEHGPSDETNLSVAASREGQISDKGPHAAPAVDIAAIIFGYRPSLKAIAAGLLPGHLKSRVDDSDLVQETLLKAVSQAN